MSLRKIKQLLLKTGVGVLTAISIFATPLSVLASEATASETVAEETSEDKEESTDENIAPANSIVYAINEVAIHTDDAPTAYILEFTDYESNVSMVREKACEPGEDTVELSFNITDGIKNETFKEDISVSKSDYKEIKSKLVDKATLKLTQDEYTTYTSAIDEQIIDYLINSLEEETVDEPISTDNDYITYDTTQSVTAQNPNDFEWDVTGLAERKTNFNLYIQKDVPVKLEIFYTKDCENPSITMVAPNTQVYSNKGDVADDSLRILNRKHMAVEGYDDLEYDVLYIYTTSEDYSGKWLFSYSISNTIKETVMISAKVEDGFDSLKVEYKTKPKFFILYYLNKDYSVYANNNIGSFLTDVVKQQERPIENDLAEAREYEKEKKDVISPFLLLLVAAIIAGCCLSVYFFIKTKEEKKNQKHFAVNKANKKLKKRRKKENEQLEKYLDKYDEDYKDDIEDLDNNNEFDKENNSDSNKIAETPVKEVLKKVEKPAVEPKKEVAQTKKENKPVKKQQAQNTQKPQVKKKQSSNKQIPVQKEIKNDVTENSTISKTEIPVEPQLVSPVNMNAAPIMQPIYQPIIQPVLQMVPIQNEDGSIQYVLSQQLKPAVQENITEEVKDSIKTSVPAVKENEVKEPLTTNINPTWRKEGDRQNRDLKKAPSWQKVKEPEDRNAFF